MQSAILLSFVASSSLPPCELQSTHPPMSCYISPCVVYSVYGWYCQRDLAYGVEAGFLWLRTLTEQVLWPSWSQSRPGWNVSAKEIGLATDAVTQNQTCIDIERERQWLINVNTWHLPLTALLISILMLIHSLGI